MERGSVFVQLDLQRFLHNLAVGLHSRRDGEVDVAIGQLNDHTADDRRVNDSLDLQLAGRFDKSLQDRLQFFMLRSVHGLRRRDLCLHLAFVRAGQRKERLGNVLQTTQTAIVTQHS